MKEQDSVTIVLHCISTLPDSISDRKRVLNALENIVPNKHKTHPDIVSHLRAIETMERLQSNLPLRFDGDGHVSHN
jgi:hypothetical protein